MRPDAARMMVGRPVTECCIRAERFYITCTWRIRGRKMKFGLLSLLVFVTNVCALTLPKRFYQPTSPMFSMIALHNGSVFQYNLVKYDGTDLLLHADDKAFFGRIKANNGYVLNIPGASGSSNNTNSTTVPPSNVNVRVDKHNKLTTTTATNKSSTHFGVRKSLLTYKNSTNFKACPLRTYRGEYEIYTNHHNNTRCPFNATGYDISLLVQIDATLNYDSSTNTRGPSMLKKRMPFYLKY